VETEARQVPSSIRTAQAWRGVEGILAYLADGFGGSAPSESSSKAQTLFRDVQRGASLPEFRLHLRQLLPQPLILCFSGWAALTRRRGNALAGTAAADDFSAPESRALRQ
jgi:hypothetical protein